MNATKNDFGKAFVEHSRVSTLYAMYLDASALRGEAVAEQFATEIRRSVLPGLYEHWKSEEGSLKYYIVYGVGLMKDVHTPIVTCAALYKPHAGEMLQWELLLEKEGFLVPINRPASTDRPAYQGPRFTLVEKLTLKEIGILLQGVNKLASYTDSVKFRMDVSDRLHRSIPLF